jgi:hypothetical protein
MRMLDNLNTVNSSPSVSAFAATAPTLNAFGQHNDLKLN